MFFGIRDPGSEIRDPGSGMGKNPDRKKPGSGINIPDPQHWLHILFFPPLISFCYPVSQIPIGSDPQYGDIPDPEKFLIYFCNGLICIYSHEKKNDF